MAMGAGDISGMATQMGREWGSTFCFIVFLASTARSYLDGMADFITHNLELRHKTSINIIQSAATVTRTLVSIEIWG